MKKILMTLAMTGLTLASAMVAQATTIYTFDDTYKDSSSFVNDELRTTDSYGGDRYNITKTEVTVDGSKLIFNLYTPSQGGYFNTGILDPQPPGDLFLDTTGGTTWNYAVDLAFAWTLSGPATLYNIASPGTVTDGTVRDNQVALYTPNGQTPVGTAGSWSINIINGDGYDYLSISIDLAAAGWHGTTDLGFHWTMSCGNDVVQDVVRPVPEPATMLLFGTGIVGLAGFARRRARK